ncbi:MAG: RNA polymerase factor sigma-54 [Smithellaceae bacterium]|nr:RNA polymerase factor sigma-54 [Smithellaceae bacterium]
MAFELRQNLKLSQQLIMTPQLQQAIKLLQLSRLELVDAINQAMEANPLIEEVTPNEEDERTIEAQDVQQDLMAGNDISQRTQEITGEGDGKEEFDWQNYMEDRVSVGGAYERRDASEAPAWDNLVAMRPSLTDHLMWQLKLSPLTPEEMSIGEQIIGNLDTDGYLREGLDAIARDLEQDTALVEAVLKKIQQFDPLGIAARDLTECLLIQAEILGMATPTVQAIIKDHLKNLELKNYSLIARKLSLPLDEVLQAIALIKNMDPKPGGVYAEERLETIIPDVYVVKAGDEYKILLNEDSLPNLRISNYYRNLIGTMRRSNGTDKEKKFIKENTQAASWFLKSLQKRQRTIFRVAESIVRVQREFLDKGINYLKPLVLRDVAEDVEMHESTISRVVTNKYMQTPEGIYELKFFFGSAIQTTNGDTVSSRSVKEDIKRIISEEDHNKPYRDQDIVKMLEASGISIARRTVAKYREMLRILPASKRKKYV